MRFLMDAVHALSDGVRYCCVNRDMPRAGAVEETKSAVFEGEFWVKY